MTAFAWDFAQIGAELFSRSARVVAGSTEIVSAKSEQQLRVVFHVKRDQSSVPNSATLEIYNLSEQTRSKFEKDGFVSIEAGYVDNTRILFEGALDRLSETFTGVDRTTYIEALDGGVEWQTKRISKSFGKDSDIKDVIRAAADATGYGLGNLEKVLADTMFPEGVSQFNRGIVLSGRASEEFEKLMRFAGLTWSVQNSEIQVLTPSDANTEKGVLLNSTAGLIGSPEIGDGGSITATSLLQGSLMPGKMVRVESRSVNGLFKVQSVEHSGDTWGTEWFSKIEGTPV